MAVSEVYKHDSHAIDCRNGVMPIPFEHPSSACFEGIDHTQVVDSIDHLIMFNAQLLK